MTIRDLIILTLCLFFLYYIITKSRETLDAVIVTNAFSNLRCVSDKENNTLPIIRVIDNKTFQCLSKNKDDTTNCMIKDDFQIPNNISCNFVNQYLSKDGVRNKKLPTRRVFDTLESSVNYNLLTCTQDGLKDPNHWCGKLYKIVSEEKCPSTEGKFGVWANPCKQMPEFVSREPVGSNTTIVTRDDIINAKNESKLLTDITRNPALCGGVRPCKNQLNTRNCVLTNQNNGNISLVDKRTKQTIWESNTTNIGESPYTMSITNNGNLILVDKNNQKIWESGSSEIEINKLYKANVLEKNNKCSLEISNKDNKVIWTTPIVI